MLLVAVLEHWVNARIVPVDIAGAVEDAEGEITWNLDLAYREVGVLFIRGYAYKEGESITSWNSNIVIRDNDTGAYYRLPTDMVSRPDLQDYAKNNENYAPGGFQSVTYLDCLPANYSVYILYRNNGENLLIGLPV